MPLMVHGDGEANLWLPGIYLCNNSTATYNQKLPCAYIKLAREAVNACKINRKMGEINLFQAKKNPLTSVFQTQIIDVNKIYIT